MKVTSKIILTLTLLWTTGCSGGSNNSSPPVISTSSASSLSTSSSSSSSSVSSAASSASSVYADFNTSPKTADSTGVGSTAMQLASKIKLGLNIGNTLEATGGETAWGNPMITASFVQFAKQSGFNAIRLPVAWDQYANLQTAQISATWLQRVKDVVQYCVDNDLYVIVNIHWDGGWLENHVLPESKSAVNAKQKAYWQQIATSLRDFDEHVMFASANEPNVETAEQMSVLLSYHQTFIDAVRATGGKNAYRVLIVQGPSTDVDKTNQLMTTMPVDTTPDRLMVEVHYYTPWNFTGMTKDETWGNQFFYWGKDFHSSTDTAHNPTWGEEDTVDAKMALMKTQFVDKGIPVIIGEFGAMDRKTVTANAAILNGAALDLHHAGRAYYFKYVTGKTLADGMVPFYWDTGSLLDRNLNSVIDQQSLTALQEGTTAH